MKSWLDGYKHYPVIKYGDNFALKTEYGLVEISQYSIYCHQCKKPLVYCIRKEDKPRICNIDRNTTKEYEYYLNGDCVNVHGGFGQPCWPIKQARQSTIDRWF